MAELKDWLLELFRSIGIHNANIRTRIPSTEIFIEQIDFVSDKFFDLLILYF